jgi:hypothetical protein
MGIIDQMVKLQVIDVKSLMLFLIIHQIIIQYLQV